MRSSLRKSLVVSLLALLVASPALALEKRSARIDADRQDAWRAGTTCSLVYYNYCTGWIWVWSNWSPSDVVGVAFESCCGLTQATAVGTGAVYFSTGSPGGYGFTGTLDLYDADTDQCPSGDALASQPFLPSSSWNYFDFGGMSAPDGTFAVAVTFGTAVSNPATIGTDHPDAGPDGPVACGYCYPTTRVNHTFYWGTASSPLCPGSSLFDGVCDAQLLLDVAVSCSDSVDRSSWGHVKNLYR